MTMATPVCRRLNSRMPLRVHCEASDCNALLQVHCFHMFRCLAQYKACRSSFSAEVHAIFVVNACSHFSSCVLRHGEFPICFLPFNGIVSAVSHRHAQGLLNHSALFRFTLTHSASTRVQPSCVVAHVAGRQLMLQPPS